MITPEELKNLAKKEFDIADMMPEYMELFEERARKAIAEGKTKMILPYSLKIMKRFDTNDDMEEALAKELMKQGFTLRNISVKHNGILNQPHWYVFFIDDNN